MCFVPTGVNLVAFLLNSNSDEEPSDLISRGGYDSSDDESENDQ